MTLLAVVAHTLEVSRTAAPSLDRQPKRRPRELGKQEGRKSQLERSAGLLPNLAHSLGLAPQPVAIRTKLVFFGTLEVVLDTLAPAVMITCLACLEDKNRGLRRLVALGADVVPLGILEIILESMAPLEMIASLARLANEDRGLENRHGRLAIRCGSRRMLALLAALLGEQQPRQPCDSQRED